jgi:hypothetical protein
MRGLPSLEFADRSTCADAGLRVALGMLGVLAGVPGAQGLSAWLGRQRLADEDVLIVRVHGLAPPDEIERRYGAINEFETRLSADGVTVIKCFLHISRDKQRDRLLERLDDPAKRWKFNPHDSDERGSWDDYTRAYEIVLERCNTDTVPWHVIPSDRKWYRNWLVTTVLLEHLQALDPQWPPATYDVEAQRQRLADS